MIYNNQIGDHKLTIFEEDGKNKVSMEDEFNTSLVVVEDMSEEDCQKLIREFEDPDGDIMYEPGSVHLRYFPQFMP